MYRKQHQTHITNNIDKWSQEPTTEQHHMDMGDNLVVLYLNIQIIMLL